MIYLILNLIFFLKFHEYYFNYFIKSHLIVFIIYIFHSNILSKFILILKFHIIKILFHFKINLIIFNISHFKIEFIFKTLKLKFNQLKVKIFHIFDFKMLDHSF